MPDLVNLVGGGPLLIIVAVIIVALLASYVASRYRVANANEALIVAGSRGAKVRDERGDVAAPKPDDKGIRVVVGGGTFVLPLIHKVGKLKLTARQIGVALPDAVTSQGIKVAVQGVSTFKIGRDVESIRNAAERFLDAKDEQVDSIVKNVLEGSLRSIVGTLTIEELIMDRQKLLQQVQDSAKGDLATSGLQIDAFTIQSISDESGYIDLLGQQKLAVVERDARVAKAGADQEAAVREAEAEQIKVNAQRDVELRRAEVLTQTAAAQARANQAGPLAQAQAQQEVTERQTELAELEAARKEKELLTSTVRPAEAEAEAVVKRAEGDRQAKIAAAQAEAERARLAGEAEARVAVAKGEAQARVVALNADAEAHRTSVEGNAEAEITLTQGEAAAKALALRAEAYKQFNDAAVIQTVLSMLPEIVRAAAEPMGRIGSLTVLSSDGASEMVKTTTRTVAEAGATVKGLTGIDVAGLINEAMGRQTGDGDGASRSTTATTVSPPPPQRGSSPSRPPRTAPATAEPGAGSGGDEPMAGQPAPAERFADAVESIERAGSVRPAEEGAVDIPARMPLDEAAVVVAEALDRVPGIRRYADMPLHELSERGPRPARALWNRLPKRVRDRFGDATIASILDRPRGDD